MKHNIFPYLATAFILLATLSSCDGVGDYSASKGYLSFAMDVDTEVKSPAMPLNTSDYVVVIKDVNGTEAIHSKFSKLTFPLTLAVGNYTLYVRSSEEEPVAAAFDYPVLGASTTFNIKGAEETTLGTVTCTPLQTMVTVSYDSEFLERVSRDSKTKVTVNAPLEYFLNVSDGVTSYEKRTGYFLTDGDNSTMIVEFDGYYDNKKAVMRKTFSNITPASLHNLTFVNNDVTGNASFTIAIDGFVEDEELNQCIENPHESIIGDDPAAPMDDGGIELQSTCDFDISQPIVVPPAGEDFTLTMKAVVPDGVKRFTVEISSTNESFVGSVRGINDGSNILNLVDPSGGAINVFTEILPFPYGDAVRGKTEIDFDLSDAQAPLLAFKGSHSFIMHVIDNSGHRKDISINMIVE